VHPLRPGSAAHVPARFARQLRNSGADAAVVLIIGASGGYVGRDGRPVDDGAAPGASS